MDFTSLLFGNLGNDDELKNAFSSGGSLLQELARGMSLDEELTNKAPASTAEQAIKPAADAIDFSDLKDEEELPEDIGSEKTVSNSESRKEAASLPSLTMAVPKRSVEDDEIQRIFPQFKKGKLLKFSELFSGNIHNFGQSRHSFARIPSRLQKDMTQYVVKLSIRDADERILFESTGYVPAENKKSFPLSYKDFISLKTKNFAQRRKEQLKTEMEKGHDQKPLPVPESSIHPIQLDEWEHQIMWDEEDSSNFIQPEPVEDLIPLGRFAVPNYDIEVNDWLENIIWEENDADRLKNIEVEINLNDPNLSVEITASQTPNSYMSYLRKRRMRPTARKPQNNFMVSNLKKGQSIQDPYNISNDRYYEYSKRSGRIRQQFGKIFIQHSLPALKLQAPFFKRYMSKSDLRSFHRPQFKVTPNESIRPIKVKNMKKKLRLKGQDATKIFSSTKDITLRDNSDYVLFEYSEEYPPMLSNRGMSNMILNYYRKKDERDQFIPKAFDGAPAILENIDASPFFGFGDVPPGETVPTIKNNMYIAPIFRQELHNEDFVLIKQTHQGQVRYYVRTIPRIYVVGQTFPLTVVPPPQSRKVKTYVRDRLKAAAFRRIRKRGRHIKYPVNKMVNTFQRYHEQSLRKHLRDAFDVQRSKKSNSLLLSIKNNVQIPSEQELQRLVSPEMACIFETMRVAQQRLADCGYGTGEVGGDEDGEQNPENILDDEIQMAPWNITKHFQLATQQKGMVQVYGPGDPTGRGEGFSFFWRSMKEMFLWSSATEEDYDSYYQSQVKTGHKFSLVDQQRYYRAEIDKAWRAQMKALSSTQEIVPSEQELAKTDDNQSEVDAELQEMMKLIQQSEKEKNPNPTATGSVADEAETHSVGSSRNMVASKSLLIRRKIRNENGEEVWVEEVVVDPRVVNAYLKQKKFGGSGEEDDEIRKKKIQEELRRLKRESGLTARDLVQVPVSRVEKDGTRRLGSSHRKCRSCGQIGHISTNRICPDFAKNFPDRVKKDKKKEGPVKAHDGKIMIQATALKEAEAKYKKDTTLKLPSKFVKPS